MSHRRLSVMKATLFVLLIAYMGATHLADYVSAEAPAPPVGFPHYLPMLGFKMVTPLQSPAPPPPAPHPGLPLQTFVTDDFLGPSICAKCHADLADQTGADVTMSTHWRSTMMANAARDPLWQAKVSAEIQRHPELQAEIEATCSRCHMPMAYTQARAQGLTPAIFAPNGFLDPSHSLHDATLDGVSCTLCHQIQPTGLGAPASFSGHFVIDVSTSPPDRALFGPYPDPDMMGTMIMRAGSNYTPLQGSHLSSSALCAACHTLFTPATDAHGQTIAFPEQTPYLEWQHSAYSDGAAPDQQCQDCHMPLANGGVALYSGWEERSPFYQHYFVGANVFMLKILQAHVAELNLTASTAEFQATIDRTLQQLQQQTAEVHIADASTQNNRLTATVHVANKTGHKFPTGYPARRAWLHVTVVDSAGKLVFESGRALSHGGIQGGDADYDLPAFEPHHRTISQPGDVQIYEAIMENAAGEVTHTLLDAVAYTKDNRLLPAGFDKATAGASIAVHGDASADADFLAGGDDVLFDIALTGYTAPFTIKVELLYQTASYAFLQDLQTSDTPQVARFSRYLGAADKSPTLIHAVEAVVP